MSLSKGEASSLRSTLRQLVRDQTASYLELGKLFHQVTSETVPVGGHPTPLYAAWGYGSFNLFVTGELGLYQYKASRAVLVYETLGITLQIDEKRLHNLSPSKLYQIARVLDRKGVNQARAEKWLKVAEKNTAWELLQKVDVELGLKFKGESRIMLHTTDTDGKEIKAAAAEYCESANIQVPIGKAIAAIVKEWRAIHAAKASKTKLKLVAKTG